MIDNYELDEIMDILENYQNEELAVVLLKEFNEKTTRLGKLLMNLDPSLTSEEWKLQCDQAKKDIDAVVKKIRDNQ
ncbi:MAG: hypothetical protein L6Q33_09680 [Bacteriovoracaceae bacterium]|jgi:hypothetical protein|nr:hypothetical protein [Bacteriovoracaceae bacterium]